MKKNFIPEGVADINYEEYEKMSAIETSVLDVFRRAGYRQIMTPTFEYYDLFSDGDISVDTEDMYKIVDTNGKIMVLRPDATVPIARMVATHYKDGSGDVKLMYLTNVFRSADYRAGGKREFRQAGIEYFGTNSSEVDAGIILTAIDALQKSGFHDLTTEIGNADYFNGFMEELASECGINDAESEAVLRSMMESKNIPGLIDFCRERKLPQKYTDVILEMPLMYGDIADVTERAWEISVNEKMRAAVSNIRSISEKVGKSVSMTVDMGLISSLDYYSGMIFRLYLKDSGAIIGS